MVDVRQVSRLQLPVCRQSAQWRGDSRVVSAMAMLRQLQPYLSKCTYRWLHILCLRCVKSHCVLNDVEKSVRDLLVGRFSDQESVNLADIAVIFILGVRLILYANWAPHIQQNFS